MTRAEAINGYICAEDGCNFSDVELEVVVDHYNEEHGEPRAEAEA